MTNGSLKHLHYILKHDTKDAALSWFAVGEYKKRANPAARAADVYQMCDIATG